MTSNTLSMTVTLIMIMLRSWLPIFLQATIEYTHHEGSLTDQNTKCYESSWGPPEFDATLLSWEMKQSAGIQVACVGYQSLVGDWHSPLVPRPHWSWNWSLCRASALRTAPSLSGTAAIAGSEYSFRDAVSTTQPGN